MKKVIFILLSIVIWCACEDETEPIVGLEGVASEFVDERDGKVYKCVAIGDQIWMAENLAYRLPQGGLDGCYTYREDVVDTNKVQPQQEDFYAEVTEAIEDGRISKEPLPEIVFAPTSPADVLKWFWDQPVGDFMAQVHDYVSYYPSLAATELVLKDLISGMKGDAIIAAAKEALAKAENVNGGYTSGNGLLYTYEGAQKACPEGWRLPTDEDWKKLERLLGMDEHELDLLEEWRGKEAGILLHDVKTAFGVVYSGARVYGRFNFDSPYMNKGMNAYYWSSSQIVQNDSTAVAIIRTVSRVNDGILRGTSNMTAAYSIRCIKE